MKLYHATYDKNFESILFNGLNPKLGKKSWRVSDLNYVFLSSDPNLAKWYAVTADLVNSETKKKILIYEVDSESLERSKLKRVCHEKMCKMRRNKRFDWLFCAKSIKGWKAVIL